MASSFLQALSRFWWLFIAAGVAWVILALVILQFDQASITTVGVLIGLLLLLSGIQNFALGAMITTGARWVFWIFGAFLIVGGVIALMSPENTFAALADILGFVFLIIGVFWTIDAFMSRGMLAFWTSGQFFIDKAYLLLVFAGIWALLHGVTDIVRGFQLHALSRG